MAKVPLAHGGNPDRLHGIGAGKGLADRGHSYFKQDSRATYVGASLCPIGWDPKRQRHRTVPYPGMYAVPWHSRWRPSRQARDRDRRSLSDPTSVFGIEIGPVRNRTGTIGQRTIKELVSATAVGRCVAVVERKPPDRPVGRLAHMSGLSVPVDWTTSCEWSRCRTCGKVGAHPSLAEPEDEGGLLSSHRLWRWR